jgi:hypothetical protein
MEERVQSAPDMETLEQAAVGVNGLTGTENDRPEASSDAETSELGLVEAEMVGLRQEQERELAVLRSELAEAQRGHIEAYRRALLAEHAGQIVDEMVTGNTLEELDASAEIARATYSRALEAARRELGGTLAPIGASLRMTPSSDELSPIAKITAALGRR